MAEIITVSVSRLVNHLKRKFEVDQKLQNINITGEISNFRQGKSNHLYFTLKDEYSRIDCVMFAGYTSSLDRLPKDGDKVCVLAKVDVYYDTGKLQLNVRKITHDGKGDLYKEFLKLKEKLQNQGLFDESHKKTINKYPSSIAVVVGRDSAAYKDIKKTLEIRWPLAVIHLLTSNVQGEKASKEISSQLQEADKLNVDTIILARGGGSIEDLWAFNDEELAHTIYNLNTPIICGVGHESDFTIADFVSDRREATPTAAATFASYDKQVVIKNKSNIDYNMNYYINNKIKAKNEQLLNIKESIIFKKPTFLTESREKQIIKNRQSLSNYLNKLKEYQTIINANTNKQGILVKNKIDKYSININKELVNIQNYINRNNETKSKELYNYIGLLDAYSPLKILIRGYNITFKNNEIIKNSKDINIDDDLTIKFHDGDILCKVKEVR